MTPKSLITDKDREEARQAFKGDSMLYACLSEQGMNTAQAIYPRGYLAGIEAERKRSQERLREAEDALSFYADKENYHDHWREDALSKRTVRNKAILSLDDCGKRARAYLEKRRVER